MTDLRLLRRRLLRRRSIVRIVRQRRLPLLGIGLIAAATVAGCAKSPPPPRVPVPGPGNTDVVREHDPAKPLPDSAYRGPEPTVGFDDVPLINQRPPEQRAFVDAYNRVGRPRITVFVNRTLQGDIVPVTDDRPLATVEHTRRSTTGVTIENRDTYTSESRRRSEDRERIDRFESKGPGEYRETTDVYLRPGQYDELQAKALDYEAVENILTDWLASNGQVTIISPTMVRQKLTPEQVKDLESGRPQVLSEIAQQLGTDVLVQAQARPTKQTFQGLQVRLVAEAINIKGGESIARAVVDIEPPLDKPQMNRHTRFVARKLMDDMIGAWSNVQPERRDEAAPPPATAPGR
jgi:hypothetical protein